MALPPTRREERTDILFQTPVADPYQWLEDIQAPEVRAWVEAQNHAAREFLDAIPGREALRNRFRELFYVDSIGAPAKRGERYFYTRTHATKEKAVVYWRQGKEGEERVLLDPNTMSSDGTTSLGVWAPTRDGSLVAYALRENNADEATLYVMEVESGTRREIDRIEGAKYAYPYWTPAGDGFYYTYLPTDPSIPVAERPGYAEVRFHKLGTDPKTDAVIREKTGDPTTFLSASLSRDGRWLLLYIQHGWSSTDVYWRDLQGAEAWHPLVVSQPYNYSIEVWQDAFYIHTNEGAPRYQVFRASAHHPARDQWTLLVPEHPQSVLESVALVGGHLSLEYLHNASSRLELKTLDGAPVREILFPELGSSSNLYGRPDEDEAYYGFNSFLRPTEIFQVSVATGEARVWSRVALPIDPTPYEVEQVWYPSKDGTRVSMFIVRKKDAPKDGTMPFLLYGYGGFSVNMTSSFSSGLYPWLEMGGGYALPNLRGGAEYGEAWHQAGMRGAKQNVFDDFVAAAEFLIREGYTSPHKLAISGGSNGGLLVGAAMTQRPDLFRAVICAVPLLDMVRYTQFGSGKTWIDEYGDPSKEEEFKWLYAYSPYHKVTPGTSYPALLMMAADSDDRVDPMHARKFVAAVQFASASEAPALLRVEKNAGHGGADLVKQAVESSVDRFSFLFFTVGLGGSLPVGFF